MANTAVFRYGGLCQNPSGKPREVLEVLVAKTFGDPERGRYEKGQAGLLRAKRAMMARNPINFDWQNLLRCLLIQV